MATTSLNKIIVVIATITALAIVFAAKETHGNDVIREYLVGGSEGWTYGQDYQAMTNNYEFYVGEALRFKYRPGEHDVVEVDEENFYKCTVPPGAKILTSGDDLIKTPTRGRRYFICSVKDGHHCRDGKMKFYIDVLGDGFSSTGMQGTRKLVTEKL